MLPGHLVSLSTLSTGSKEILVVIKVQNNREREIGEDSFDEQWFQTACPKISKMVLLLVSKCQLFTEFETLHVIKKVFDSFFSNKTDNLIYTVSHRLAFPFIP